MHVAICWAMDLALVGFLTVSMHRVSLVGGTGPIPFVALLHGLGIWLHLRLTGPVPSAALALFALKAFCETMRKLTGPVPSVAPAFLSTRETGPILFAAPPYTLQ